jgi:hypothetical protein
MLALIDRLSERRHVHGAVSGSVPGFRAEPLRHCAIKPRRVSFARGLLLSVILLD